MNEPRHPFADTRPDADDHARTWALMPWLVNGRAEGEARHRALAHLEQCADCRAEWRAQQSLARALQDSEPQAVALPAAEAGLQRLLGRLDRLPQDQALPSAQPAGSPPAADARRAGRLPLALAAAVLVQAVCLSLLSLQLARGGHDTFAPLSQPAARATGVPAATLRLLPDGAMPLAQWQALLQTHDLVVLEGPNSAGAYGVAPRQRAAAPAADTLARLRATPGVLLVEPLVAP
jgi:hypothetical protein